MSDSYSLKAQDLLYKRPLYQYIGKNESDMNVLVIGWNDFSEAFVDQCLQAGQMNLHFLTVTILTVDSEQKRQQYLSARPALDGFVNVDGSLDNANKDLEIYAKLNFKEFNEEVFQSNSNEKLMDILLDVLGDAPGEKYHYFVISTGNHQINKRVATQLSEVVAAFMPSEKNAIHYVTVKNQIEDEEERIVPIYLDDIQSILDINPELERMAYNAHLTWDDAINGDALAELEKFRADTYNYTSSVALALSIPYKLADIGIELKDYHVAAEEYWKAIANIENQDTVNRIIALEHRRWVINQICQGWVAPLYSERQKYYDSCIERMKVKDVANKIHPCIVRSTTDTPLSTGSFKDNRADWDTRNDAQDANLDELDRVSVELHRRMYIKAEVYRKNLPLEKGEIPEIYEILKSINCSEMIIREWERFVFCIKNILDGNYAYSKQYDKYEARLVSKLCVEESYLEEIKKKLSVISKNLWPVIEANLYRDYKK